MSSALVRARVNEFRDTVAKLQDNDSAPVVLLTTKRLEELNSSLQRLLDTSISEQKLAIRSELRLLAEASAASSSNDEDEDESASAAASAAARNRQKPGPLVSYFQAAAAAAAAGQGGAAADELEARRVKLEVQLGRAASSSKHWQVCLTRCTQTLVGSIPPTNTAIARRLPAWVRQQMELFCRQCFFPLVFYGLPGFEDESAEAEVELDEEDWQRLVNGLGVVHRELHAPHHLVYLFKAVVQPVVVRWTAAVLTSHTLSEQEFRSRLAWVLPSVRHLPQVGLAVGRLFKQFVAAAAAANESGSSSAVAPSADDMVEWRSLLGKYKISV